VQRGRKLLASDCLWNRAFNSKARSCVANSRCTSHWRADAKRCPETFGGAFGMSAKPALVRGVQALAAVLGLEGLE